MRRSSKTLAGTALVWSLVTATSALILLGTRETFWLASHDARVASVVWPMLGVIFVSGITLLLAVHFYVRSLLVGTGREVQ